MVRPLLAVLTALVLVGMVGCGGRNYGTYVSKKGDCTLRYPARWDVIDDREKLDATTKELARKVGNYLIDIDLEAVFRSRDGIGLVARTYAPESVRDKRTLDSLKVFMRSETRKQDIDIRSINGRDFLVIGEQVAGDMRSVTAYCLNADDICMFQFACPENKAARWVPKFEECVNSISFRTADIAAARKEQPGKAGFLSGLWHGYLIPFRWVAVSLWDFDLYARSNTGAGYMAGFIIGVLVFLVHWSGSLQRRK